MSVTAIWWVGFNLGVLVLLGVDLLVFNRVRRAPTFQESLGLTVFWVALAAGFGAGICMGWVGGDDTAARSEAGLQFFTAYALEASLSLDNVFVWALLFRHFQVPAAHQRGVLSCGVVVAMLMRAVMVLGGVALARHFAWIFYLFGAYLLYAAVKMWHTPQAPERSNRNPAWSLLQQWVPATEKNPEGKILVRRAGRWLATPLLGVLIALELGDIVFALDSVPAVLGVTTDPFIAFTSNILAVLGLRAMYFLLQHVIARCWLLHYGLAVLLGFIGLKMLLAHLLVVPLGVSLAVIAAILAVSIAGSFIFKAKASPAAH